PSRPSSAFSSLSCERCCLWPWCPPEVEMVAQSRRLRRGALDLRLRSFELRGQVVAIHARDEVDRDALGADRFALAEHRAGAEHLVHDLDHLHDALVALRLSLRQESEVRDLGASEEMRGAVRALCDARAALD